MDNTNNPLKIMRIFDAPVEKLWQALTDPDQMQKWYFDLPGFKAEVGHQFNFDGGPPEQVYHHLCTVTEVIPLQRLSYTWRYDGYAGDSLVTFELMAQGEKTMLKLTHSGLETFPADNPDLAAENFKDGWTEILSTHLPEYFQNEPRFKVVRTLNAPRELVFKVWTMPEHLAHWWGPAGLGLRVVKHDLRPGGLFHYAMIAPDGTEMFGRFAFRHITPPERLVWVNSFANAEGEIIPAPFPGNFPQEVYNMMTLTENDGVTTLTLEGFPINASQEELDFYAAMFENMNKGFGGTLAQLETYLQTLAG